MIIKNVHKISYEMETNVGEQPGKHVLIEYKPEYKTE